MTKYDLIYDLIDLVRLVIIGFAAGLGFGTAVALFLLIESLFY
jgi:hypothetical protein